MSPSPSGLHPRAADYYRAITEDLVGALNAEDGAKARDLVRSLIERVDFQPRHSVGAFDLVVHGKLAAPFGVSERAAATSAREVIGGCGDRI
jgi:hypothetical protein